MPYYFIDRDGYRGRLDDVYQEFKRDLFLLAPPVALNVPEFDLETWSEKMFVVCCRLGMAAAQNRDVREALMRVYPKELSTVMYRYLVTFYTVEKG